MDASTPEPLMTTKELAVYLQMDARYIYRLVERKAIPHYRVSARTIRFRKSEIDEWMKKIHPQEPPKMAGIEAPDA